MNTQQRLDRALQIRAALQDLMTTEEADTYEDLDNHFCDYIRDLAINHQRSLPSLPAIWPMDNHHAMLNLFEEFERAQDKLEASNLLKLATFEPQYTVNAYSGSTHEWEDWAYDNDELESLKKIATESGYTVTVCSKDKED